MYPFRWTILLALLAVCLSFSPSSSSDAVEVEIEQGIMSATASSSPPNSFPDLNGIPGEEAKSKIEKEYPSLLVQIVPEDSMVTMDYREDRVRIFVDTDGKVARVPILG